MSKMNLLQAINNALDIAMSTDESAKFRYRSGNEFNVGGLTIRTPMAVALMAFINGSVVAVMVDEIYFKEGEMVSEWAELLSVTSDVTEEVAP